MSKVTFGANVRITPELIADAERRARRERARICREMVTSLGRIFGGIADPVFGKVIHRGFAFLVRSWKRDHTGFWFVER